MEFGENIKKARKTAGMSQTDLADQLGVKQKDVSRWENDVHMPNLEMLVKICRALDVSSDQILGLK